MKLVFNLITIAIATTFIHFTSQTPYRGFDVQQGLYERLNYEKPWYLRQDLDGSAAEESSNKNDKTMLSYDKNNQRQVIVVNDGVLLYHLENEFYKKDGRIHDVYENINGKRYYKVGKYLYMFPKTKQLLLADKVLLSRQDPHNKALIHSNQNYVEKDNVTPNKYELPHEFHFKR